MTDSIRFYDRTLPRLSRRELLNIAWKLGAAAVAQPFVSTRAGAAAVPHLSVYARRRVRRAVARRRRAVDAARAGAAGRAAACRWPTSKSAGRSRAIARSGPSSEGDGGGAAGARAQRARRGRRARARARLLLSLPRRRRGQPDRPHEDGAAAGAPVDRLRFAVCGCSHYETGYFTAFRRLAAEQFDFVFHTGDYIYEGRADGGRNPALVRQHQGDEIYTLVDYRNRYAQYKIRSRSARRARVGAVHRDLGRSRGRQRLRGRSSTRTTRRRKCSCCAAPPPIRRSTRRCRSGVARSRAARTCGSIAGCSFGRLIDLERARHAAVPIRTRRVATTSATGCAAALRSRAHDPRRRRRSGGCSSSSATAKATWTVLGQQVPTFARDMTSGQRRRRATRWTSGTATSRRGSGSTPGSRRRRRRTRSCCRATCTSTTARISKLDFDESAIADRRRRVHQYLDHLRWRRRRRERHLGADSRRQSAHQVSQRAPRLHRLHGDADDDARRVQGPGPRHRAGRRRADRRVAGRRGGPSRVRRAARCWREAPVSFFNARGALPPARSRSAASRLARAAERCRSNSGPLVSAISGGSAVKAFWQRTMSTFLTDRAHYNLWSDDMKKTRVGRREFVRGIAGSAAAIAALPSPGFATPLARQSTPKIKFAVIGLNHGHINGQTEAVHSRRRRAGLDVCERTGSERGLRQAFSAGEGRSQRGRDSRGQVDSAGGQRFDPGRAGAARRSRHETRQGLHGRQAGHNDARAIGRGSKGPGRDEAHLLDHVQ